MRTEQRHELEMSNIERSWKIQTDEGEVFVSVCSCGHKMIAFGQDGITAQFVEHTRSS